MPCAFRIDVAHFLWENKAMPTAGYRDAPLAPEKLQQTTEERREPSNSGSVREKKLTVKTSRGGGLEHLLMLTPRKD